MTIGQKIASQNLSTTEVTNSQLVKPISTIVHIRFVASQPTLKKNHCGVSLQEKIPPSHLDCPN
jgi:hypothetical protein